MATSSVSRRRTKRHRLAVVKSAVVAELTWKTCRFTVQVSYIDPCCPAFEFHTDDKAAALETWHKQAVAQDRQGGEWSVELFEHPKDRPPTRRVYRRGEGREGFIYWAEYPRSKCLKKHDYMQPRLPKPNE